MELTLIKRFKRGVGPVGALASLLIASAAQAGTDVHKLMLSGYEDAAAGPSLMAGRYDAVISALAAHGPTYQHDLVEASTNLCVAYIMRHQWEAADSACDAAVDAAKPAVTGTLFERKQHDESIALAYSNRAVLHWLEDHPDLAASDFAMARLLSPEAEFVSHNVAAFSSAKSAAAQAVVAGHS
jgi:hypothetical protein